MCKRYLFTMCMIESGSMLNTHTHTHQSEDEHIVCAYIPYTVQFHIFYEYSLQLNVVETRKEATTSTTSSDIFFQTKLVFKYCIILQEMYTIQFIESPNHFLTGRLNHSGMGSFVHYRLISVFNRFNSIRIDANVEQGYNICTCWNDSSRRMLICCRTKGSNQTYNCVICSQPAGCSLLCLINLDPVDQMEQKYCKQERVFV